MFELTVEVPFSAAHCIRGHSGRCARLHGHNYRVVVTVAGEKLNEQGMVIDFGELKALCAAVIDPLDHSYLNEIDAFAEVNPTAEGLARHLFEMIARKLTEGVRLAAVTVYESERSYATYRG